MVVLLKPRSVIAAPAVIMKRSIPPIVPLANTMISSKRFNFMDKRDVDDNIYKIYLRMDRMSLVDVDWLEGDGSRQGYRVSLPLSEYFELKRYRPDPDFFGDRSNAKFPYDVRRVQFERKRGKLTNRIGLEPYFGEGSLIRRMGEPIAVKAEHIRADKAEDNVVRIYYPPCGIIYNG